MVELLEELLTDEPLFGNKGKAVRASVVEDEGVPSSLAVICPEEIVWRKGDDGRISAVFVHCGRELSLKVTDPAWSARFDGCEPGDYDVDAGSTYLIASLAEEHNGWHTKLVAGVIALDG